MNYAPIGISAYTRLDHLKRTIEALQNNTLTAQSDLFVFSDGPKPGDEKAVKEVRDYLKTVDGFRSTTIVERKNNDRIANQHGGRIKLLETYGRCIFMEDDIVTAPGFLQFVNDALNFYADNPKVLSISGYSPPLAIPEDYQHDVYFLRRFSAWGIGVWKEKFKLIKPVSREQLQQLKSDKSKLKELDAYGEDIIRKLERDVSGKINVVDVKAMYCQYIHDVYTVYPKKSLTNNIGFDGSGLHCGITKKFDTDLWKKTDNFIMTKEVILNDKIIESNRRFRSRIKKRIKRVLENIIMLSVLLGVIYALYKILL